MVKRMLLVLSVMCVVAASIVAPAAMAWTKGAAEQTSFEYAQNHYLGAQYGSCTSSGKNKRGEAQWYCSGKDFAGTWHVNVGPYGEITYP